jgi:hypothetical protein
MHTINGIILSLGVLIIGCADVEQTPAVVAPEAQVAPAPVEMEEAPTPVVAPPVSHTYEVDIDPALEEHSIEAVLDGVRIVNDRIGRRGFIVIIKKLEQPTDWHISVSMGPDLAPKRAIGFTGGFGLACEVQLTSDVKYVTWQAAMHEIAGHCADLEHTADKTNFMYPTSDKSTVGITDEQVALILARLDGMR